MLKQYWKKYGTIAAAAVFLTVAGLGYGFLEAGPESESTGIILTEPGENKAPESGETGSGGGIPGGGETADREMAFRGKESSGEEQKSGGIETPAGYFIHICGEVKNPGVYELPEGSRIYEAVEAAGGFTGEAAEDSLNLAQKISDGQQIVVLSCEEVLRRAEAGISDSGQQDGESNSGPVNINTASRALLMTLNGIGESRADDIIRYREEHGDFARIEDIMKVPGIKDAAFQKIKDSITV